MAGGETRAGSVVVSRIGAQPVEARVGLVGRRQGVDRLRESGVAAVARFPLRRDLSMPFQPFQSIGLLRVWQTFLLCVYPRNSPPKSSTIVSRRKRLAYENDAIFCLSGISRSYSSLLYIYIFYIFNKGIYICMYVYRMRIVLRVATCGEATSVVRISLPKHIHRGLVGSSIV